jgi:hypothetical protein
MNERKKYILISVAMLVGLLLVTFAPMLFGDSDDDWDETESGSSSVSTPTPEPVPTITAIGDFDELNEVLPENRIDLIEKNLFDTIKMNVTSSDNWDATDAVIRDGSYKQSLYDTGKQITFTTFIVDIPSLKQSYRVNDYYSPFPVQMSGLLDYATLVLCLEKADLVYGEFDCMDRIKWEEQ